MFQVLSQISEGNTANTLDIGATPGNSLEKLQGLTSVGPARTLQKAPCPQKFWPRTTRSLVPIPVETDFRDRNSSALWYPGNKTARPSGFFAAAVTSEQVGASIRTLCF